MIRAANERSTRLAAFARIAVGVCGVVVRRGDALRAATQALSEFFALSDLLHGRKIVSH